MSTTRAMTRWATHRRQCPRPPPPVSSTAPGLGTELIEYRTACPTNTPFRTLWSFFVRWTWGSIRHRPKRVCLRDAPGVGAGLVPNTNQRDPKKKRELTPTLSLANGHMNCYVRAQQALSKHLVEHRLFDRNARQVSGKRPPQKLILLLYNWYAIGP